MGGARKNVATKATPSMSDLASEEGSTSHQVTPTSHRTAIKPMSTCVARSPRKNRSAAPTLINEATGLVAMASTPGTMYDDDPPGNGLRARSDCPNSFLDQ